MPCRLPSSAVLTSLLPFLFTSSLLVYVRVLAPCVANSVVAKLEL